MRQDELLEDHGFFSSKKIPFDFSGWESLLFPELTRVCIESPKPPGSFNYFSESNI